MLRRVQVGPVDATKGVLRTDHPERAWADINVQSAVEEAAQIQPAPLEDRSLSIQRAIGIVPRRAGRDPVARNHDARDENPLTHAAILHRGVPNGTTSPPKRNQ